ncbi:MULTISPECIES: hypothetical protein [Microbacterium]|uniref:Uncharacterized protein n=1 Tax=Microbacterium wangchenii TaxID=2541726 RepID=A0ABX5SRA2_9MICO|nr:MULTISPECIES: hypothetical protein [Microbacterium]MCK6067063.1 hypothetical protein [Microbacterium sp. EYE_512]QBR88352.1 hypothetical protein E4K62_06370 [Microbacterium wangchenii]TFV83526.1 hypothetical protein E4V99_00015 [Microbacterium sp. dk485]TXK17857.1 hypothetical protein FVP99_04430 [Microbacterium wangchenii]
MIVAGLVLLAIGGVDLLRQFLPGRRRVIAYVIAAVVLLVGASAVDAVPAAIGAALAAALWVALVAPDGARRSGMWAAAVLAVVCAGAVLALGPRGQAGPLGEAWQPVAPFGPVSVDTIVAVAGATLFLLESGNIIVRSALRQEAVVVPTGSGLKGGRLIGPLERVLVFALTLAGAYTLLAAVLAAKGIVRFPEISRDGESGDRAEYFLVGSLASWACALAAAALVWWGAAPLIT